MVFLTNLWRFVLSIQCYLVVLLGLSAITGDVLVHFSKKHIYRALFDNCTHAIIGGLTWLIVSLNHRNRNSANTLLEIITCTVFSSLIDIDHFFMAKSLSLKDATNLKDRPPFHCTTLPLIATPILLFISYGFELHTLERYTLIIFTAFISHHTRDATRRGYWLYPFGSTQALPYICYVLITLLMPYFIYAIMGLLKVKKTVSYNVDEL